MDAIDTNLVVRYLTGDHPVQSRKARSIIEGGPVFIATTVLLETEWVLRSVYRYSRVQIAAALTAMAGLPSVSVQDPAATAEALVRLATGMDFADALHLAAARDCNAFLTFDRTLAKMPVRLGGVTVRAP